MARPKLKVDERKIFGRKVKKLRADGILPANIYGQKVKSQAVQLEIKKFLPVYQDVGETGLVDLLVGKSAKARPVLVHNVQYDPVGGQVIHADFHQVSLTEKITAGIPVELTGSSPADEQKLGILVRILDEIEVEALPTDLPEKIEVDISGLEKVGDMVKVKEIKLDDKKVKVTTSPKSIVAKIEPLAEIEEKPVVAEETEAEGEEGAPAEGEETPSEGEAKVPESTEENQEKSSPEKTNQEKK